ncbi:MAG TPA: M15 family metallopeptidase [Actinomycetota bacterium]|nr:M15 family metallopeptidase [Actinomycetota bacterium]
MASPRIRRRRLVAGALVVAALAAGVFLFARDHKLKPWEIAGSVPWATHYYGNPDAPKYRDRHIVEIDFDGEPMYVNKAVAPHFLRLAQIFEQEAPEYAAAITSVHDDWSYNNRDVRGADSKSMHAWGLALDINALSNVLGTEGDMPQAVVDKWVEEGGAWGGDFSRPDPMHFESRLTPSEIKERYEPDGTPRD